MIFIWKDSRLFFPYGFLQRFGKEAIQTADKRLFFRVRSLSSVLQAPSRQSTFSEFFKFLQFLHSFYFSALPSPVKEVHAWRIADDSRADNFIWCDHFIYDAAFQLLRGSSLQV